MRDPIKLVDIELSRLGENVENLLGYRLLRGLVRIPGTLAGPSRYIQARRIATALGRRPAHPAPVSQAAI
jgi:hypothetical protein